MGVDVHLMLRLDLDLVLVVYWLVQVYVVVWVESLSVGVYLLDEVNFCVFTLTLVVFFAFLSFGHFSKIFAEVFSVVHSVAFSVSHTLNSLRHGRFSSSMDIFCFMVCIINDFFILNSIEPVCILVKIGRAHV